MRENIAPYLDSVTSQNITFNRDIEMSDLEGNTAIICRCYTTIVANTSISKYIDVLNHEIFKTNREAIQVEVNKYLQEANELALKYNVPIV